MEYGAIDLHKKESQIRIVTESGEIIDQRILTTRDRFTHVFWGRPRMRILIEASTESEWVAQHLEEWGHEVVLADPNYSAMYGHRSRRIKTDRRDVAALTEACHQGNVSIDTPAIGTTARGAMPTQRSNRNDAGTDTSDLRRAGDYAERRVTDPERQGGDVCHASLWTGTVPGDEGDTVAVAQHHRSVRRGARRRR